jgi:alcohol dehydrogenase class IV
MTASITVPPLMLIGGGSVARIAEVLERTGIRHPLIVTDGFLCDSGALARLTGPLEAAGIPHSVFADTVPDPTTDVVEAGVRVLAGGGFDGLVALGGGSSRPRQARGRRRRGSPSSPTPGRTRRC